MNHAHVHYHRCTKDYMLCFPPRLGQMYALTRMNTVADFSGGGVDN